MFYVYVLYSVKYKKFYIGQTFDVSKRFNEHCKGKVSSTKKYLPYKLLHQEAFNSRDEAVLRERELKKTTGRRYLRKILADKIAEVAELADAPDSKSGETQIS